MVTIRGENVYPSEIDAVLNQMTHYGGEHRIIVSREGLMDELLVRVECTEALQQQGAGAMQAYREQVAHDVRTMLGLRTMVEVVEPGTYPRTDFKARRVVDDRQVFKDMQQRLQAGPV